MRIDYDKDQLAYALANALKERDEAREKAERYRIEANAMMMQRDEAQEAQEALRRICDLATDGYLKASDHRGLLMQISDISREKAAK